MSATTTRAPSAASAAAVAAPMPEAAPVTIATRSMKRPPMPACLASRRARRNGGTPLAQGGRTGYERRMPFLTHAGVSLRYDRVGTGPAVLLVHGWTFNRTVWERQVVALRDRHMAITVDLRGHGEASHPRTGYSVAAMAADLEHLVRALAVPRIALVGWSMGGVVAIELAQRLGERVSALGLVCTTAGGLTDAKNPHAVPKDQAAAMR